MTSLPRATVTIVSSACAWEPTANVWMPVAPHTAGAVLALLEPVGSRLPPTTPGSGESRDQPLSFPTWALKSSVVVSGEGAWSVNVVDWATTVVPFTLPMIW